MTDQRISAAPPALPPPMTVGRYVREEFPRLARYICTGMAISMPVFLGIRIREYGFSWKLLAAGVGGLLGAWLLACAALAVVLPIAGWFKLRTTIKPIIPASIAMVLAILGYVLMVNLY